jgi:hypothetical protein
MYGAGKAYGARFIPNYPTQVRVPSGGKNINIFSRPPMVSQNITINNGPTGLWGFLGGFANGLFNSVLGGGMFGGGLFGGGLFNGGLFGGGLFNGGWFGGGLFGPSMGSMSSMGSLGSLTGGGNANNTELAKLNGLFAKAGYSIIPEGDGKYSATDKNGKLVAKDMSYDQIRDVLGAKEPQADKVDAEAEKPQADKVDAEAEKPQADKVDAEAEEPQASKSPAKAPTRTTQGSQANAPTRTTQESPARSTTPTGTGTGSRRTVSAGHGGNRRTAATGAGFSNGRNVANGKYVNIDDTKIKYNLPMRSPFNPNAQVTIRGSYAEPPLNPVFVSIKIAGNASDAEIRAALKAEIAKTDIPMTKPAPAQNPKSQQKPQLYFPSHQYEYEFPN